MKLFNARLSERGGDLRVRADDAQQRRDWPAAHRLWEQETRERPESVNGWLQLGNMANELGRHDEALEHFARAAGLDPGSPDPPVGRAGVLERAGRWEEAHETWQIVALRFASGAHADVRTHALLHSALSLLQLNRKRQAREVLRLLEQVRPDIAMDQQFLGLRIRSLDNAPEERERLVADLGVLTRPTDPADCFGIASLLLDGEDQERGLEILEPGLARRPDDVSFLWLAADLNERLGRLGEVVALCERMARLEPGSPRHLRRAFAAALRAEHLVEARRLAIAFRRRYGGWDLVHELIEPYRSDGQAVRARLLCRWLCRIWPHSTWHAIEYIRLTGASRSPEAADRLIRERVKRQGRSEALDAAYADVAFNSGNFAEAVRRLRFLLEAHPDHEAAAILLGYAIANAIGFREAEEHFLLVATRQFQNRDALVGLAHMAMRRRDRDGTFERWFKVVGVHPEYDVGYVELARSAYELRRLELVHAICRGRLADAPGDTTTGEFYCWFLVATGRFAEAWDLLRKVGRPGRSWSVVDLTVQAASRLGRLDEILPRLLCSLPQGTTREAGRRLYHVIRSLHVCGRDELAPRIAGGTAVDPDHLGWLWPYLRRADAISGGAGGGEGIGRERGRRVAAAWERVRALVRDDVAERIRGADREAVARILDRPRHEQPVVNIVNKFEQVSGGSELHALDIAERVGRHATVRLWAPEMPHPHFTEHCRVSAIEPAQGRVPHGGVLVLIGVYFDVAGWLAHARPERVIFLYNTFEAPLAFQRVREVWERCGVRSELLFCSDMMGDEIGLPGLFEPSPTDIAAFSPDPAPRPAECRFRLGRHSRDVVEKHHPDDWKVYEEVARHGGGSTVLGGTCMAATFPAVDGLDLLPARSGDMVPFLRSLDCYYYRTSSWVEPWGRVVVEAMACGLPVVAAREGGYAQIIRHGENGLLFDTTEEAVALIRAVCTDPELRARLGRNARATAEELLGEEAMRRLVSFYLAA